MRKVVKLTVYVKTVVKAIILRRFLFARLDPLRISPVDEFYCTCAGKFQPRNYHQRPGASINFSILNPPASWAACGACQETLRDR